MDIGTEGDDETPNGIHTIRPRLPLHGIKLPEEAKVRLNAKPTLAKRDKTRNVEKGVGRQMMELNPIEKKQSTKEVMDWIRKPTQNEGNKHNPIPRRGTGDYLIAGESHGRRVLRDQAPLAQFAEIALPRL